MQQLVLSTGGHPFQVDDLIHLQDGINDALKAVFNGLGTGNQAFIISGAVISGWSLSEGYIFWNGEVYPVDAQSVPALTLGQQYYWILDEQVLSPSPVTYQDTTIKNVHIRRRLIYMGATPTPANSILASAVVRLNQLLGIVPQQGIIMYTGSSSNFDVTGKGKAGTQVDGWALCNGNTFAVPGGGTLTAPNLRGMFVVGWDERTSGADADYDTIGNTGGEKTHLLTANESGIPAHTHTTNPHDHNLSYDNSNSPNGGIGAPTVSNVGVQSSSASPIQDTTVVVNSNTPANAAVAHENRPPYYTVAYIVKLI